MMRSIGLRLRALREESGYTREQLAEYVELSDKFIYEVESGRKGLSAMTLIRFCSVFHVSSDYILLGVENR